MANYVTAKRAGELLGIDHLEVIRRIRRGDIVAKKFGWNWAVDLDALEEAKKQPWYKKVEQKRQKAAS